MRLRDVRGDAVRFDFVGIVGCGELQTRLPRASRPLARWRLPSVRNRPAGCGFRCGGIAGVRAGDRRVDAHAFPLLVVG